MIQVQVLKQNLDLYPNTEITMEFTSPFFTWDYTPGEYSYPFNIPASPQNKNILGFPEIVDGVNSWPQQDCEIQIQGGHVIPGRLRIISASLTSYQIAIKSGAAIFGEDVKNKSIRSLDYGAGTVITKTLAALQTHMDAKVAAGYPTNKYTYFPAYNPGMVNTDDHPDWNGFVNYYISGGFQPAETPGSNGFPYDTAPNMHPDEVVWPVPTAWLLTVIDAIFAEKEYMADGAFHSDEDLAALVINNHQPLGIDMKFYSGSAPNIQHFFPGKWSVSQMIPDITVGEFINGIRLLFCMAMTFDVPNQRVTFIPIKEIVNKKYDKDWNDKTDPSYLVEKDQLETMRLGYELNQEDALVSSLGWFTEFDPTTIDGTVADLTELAAIGSPTKDDTYLVEDLNQYHRYDGDSWQILSYNWQAWNNSNFDSEQISPISCPAMITITDSDGGRDWKIPYMNRPANLNYPLSGFWKGLEIFPELLFVHGMKNDSTSDPYPLASSYGKNYGATSENLDQVQSSFSTRKQNLWQSFTAGITGQLTAIEIIQHASSTSNSTAVYIYDGAGTGGTLLSGPQPVTFATIGAFEKITLSVPVAVIAGQVYTIRTLGTARIAYEAGTNPYAGGELDSGPTDDLAFKTYVTTTSNDAGPYSLSWHGEKGLYQTWWKDWIEFLAATKPVTRKIRLTIQDIVGFSYSDKIRIDGTNYLVKSFPVTFTMNGIKPSTFKLMKAT